LKKEVFYVITANDKTRNCTLIGWKEINLFDEKTKTIIG